jgi:tetratricopeptide (TPR) repeat protein
MKNIFLFLSCIFLLQTAGAQTRTIDAEKLLDFYQTQRYAEAAQYLQSIYPDDTQDVKVLNQIAYCNLMAGKLPEAEKNYLKIYAQQPAFLPVLFNLSNINVRKGQNVKAKSFLKSIIQLDSNNFKAYKQLADLTVDSLQLKVTYLNRANRLNATDPIVAYDLAQAYKQLGLFQPAYDILKTAIVADTSNLFLLEAQLPIANELKKYDEVITVGEKLLQNEVEVNVIKDVGKAYFFLKNYQKCLLLYQILEKMDKQTEATLYYMTLCYRELKKYELAATYAKKTIEEGISVNIVNYYATLGAIYEVNDQPTNAITAYKKGLSFNRPSASLHYRLALVYDLKLKQAKNALTYYNLYLKGKPDADKEKEQIEYTKSRIVELKK